MILPARDAHVYFFKTGFGVSVVIAAFGPGHQAASLTSGNATLAQDGLSIRVAYVPYFTCLHSMSCST